LTMLNYLAKIDKITTIDLLVEWFIIAMLNQRSIIINLSILKTYTPINIRLASMKYYELRHLLINQLYSRRNYHK
jgi:hypothetical protein